MTGVRTNRYRSLLENLTQRQVDGTYLVRPHRRIPIVYQVDEATKDRWIKFQLAFQRGIYIAPAAYVFVVVEWRWPWWLILATTLMYAALYLGTELVVLSPRQRVAANRWQGPVPVPSLKGQSKRFLVRSIVSAALAVLVFLDAWALVQRIDGGALVVLAGFGSFAAWFYVLYRRSRTSEEQH